MWLFTFKLTPAILRFVDKKYLFIYYSEQKQKTNMLITNNQKIVQTRVYMQVHFRQHLFP